MTTRLLLGLCLSLSLVACSDGDKSKPGSGDGAVADSRSAIDAAKGSATTDTPVGLDSKGSDTADTGGSTADSGSGSSTDAEPVECMSDNPCAAGVCAAASCSATWTCLLDSRPCTMDLVDYCGCDGLTFQDSGNCPGRPFAFKGKCEDGVSCDVRKITCNAIAPSCPDGDVARVGGGCYDGTCVPSGHCVCTTVADCPPGKFLCVDSRCLPPLM